MRLFLRYFTYSTILLMLFSIYSCCYEKNEKIQRIDVESNLENFQLLKLSELCNDIEYIKLETKDSCLIGFSIKYLDMNDKHILIYDWEKCLLFNRSGKFINQISKEGRGPGEYSHPGQIRILGDEIYIPDARRDLIQIFDTKGNFIENVKSPGKFSNQFQVSNYIPATDSLFFVQIPNLTGRESTRISLINRKEEILVNYKNTTFFDLEKPRFASTDLAAQFYTVNNKIRYKEQLNDTVWQIEENELSPVYVFDRGKFGTPNYIRGLPIKSFFKKLSETISIIMIYETGKFIIIKTNFMKHYPFSFYKQSISVRDAKRNTPHNILGFYNKSDKKFFFVAPTNPSDQIEPTGIENDIDGGINFMPNYLLGDSVLVGWFDAYEIKHFVESRTFKNSTPKYPEKKKELERLANSLDENDNPVLILVKLKK